MPFPIRFKERDHLMDSMRYLVMSGIDVMQRQAPKQKEPQYTYDFGKAMEQRWMQ